MIKRLFSRLYRHLHRSYPEYEGCGSCLYRPLPTAVRRASRPALPFPVDLVYTWVNGSDKKHIAKRESCLPDFEKDLKRASEVKPPALSHGAALFNDNEELRFSLRSVEKFAPWVRKIFILTDEQTPDWLNEEHEKIVVVDHKDCIPAEYLPTFNSHVIESYLHRIPGLAEHFIYMNDDFFLAAPSVPEDFFTPNGLPYLFMDWRYSRRFGYSILDTPHACSYANTRAFMKKKGFCLIDEVIVGHIPYAATKTNARRAHDFFSEKIKNFSPHKFRSFDEMAFYSHCLPYWSYFLKRAVPSDLPFFYINTARFDRKAYYRSMLKENGSGAIPLFFCLNDVGEPGQDDTRHADMREFLNAYFPQPSSAEKRGTGMKSGARA